MQPAHSDPKEFGKRSSAESKKVKDIASQMEKIKKSLEVEKKVYLVDFLKNFDLYAENAQLSPQLTDILKNHSKDLTGLEKEYDRAIEHVGNVSCNALGYLPKKYESYQKSIGVGNKFPEGLNKLKDFEFDRIEYTQKALLHFFNAQMLIHAQSLQVYSKTFDELAKHKEGQDICTNYENKQWAVDAMRTQGFQVSK